MDTDIDFDLIARELLTAIRGRLSTSRLSQRLGFRYNQVARWESGAKIILWKEFCKLAKVLNLPLARALEINYIYSHKNFANGSAILNDLKGDKTVTDFAKALQRDRLVVSRWLKGETELPLAEFLRALHLVHNNAGEFLNAIVPLTKIPHAEVHLEPHLRERRLLVDSPWIGALLGCLDLEGCPTHDKVATFAHKTFGIPKSTIEAAFVELVRLGILEIGPDQRYRHLRWFRVGPMPTDSRRMKEYWLRLAQWSVKQREETSGFFMLAVNDKGWTRVMERYRQFFSDLVEIVNDPESGPPLQQFRVVNVQMMDLVQLGKEVDLAKV